MRFDWYEGKAASNLANHGVSFELAKSFDVVTASITVDDRHDYGETRLVALGLIGARVMVLVYTERDDGETVWVISLRKANKREIKAYVESL